MEVLGVIGNPIAHSLSPVMHSRALAAVRKEAVYLRSCVEAKELETAIRGAAALGYTGLNVTVPFKEAAFALMDECTPEAERVGAVNTIRFCPEGYLQGHNTDGHGFLAALAEELGLNPAGASVLVIGAGGSARAITNALLQCGAKVYLANRTYARALALAEALQYAHANPSIHVVEMGSSAFAGIARSATMCINTTSAGMKPQLDAVPMDPQLLGLDTTVVDIVYNPQRTLFLQQAEQRGLRTQNGVGMLVWQAVKSWEFWWNEQPPAGVMREAVLEALNREA